MTWWEALKMDWEAAGNQLTAKRLAEVFHYKHSNAVYALFHGELPFKLDSLKTWYELTGAQHLMRWAGSVTNHHVAPIPTGRVDDLQYSDLLREFSEVVAEYTAVVSDGNVTPAEASRVTVQCQELITAALRLSLATERRATTIPLRPGTMAEAEVAAPRAKGNGGAA